MQIASKLNSSFMIVLLLAGVVVVAFNPQVASAEISVDSYCRLTIQSMQQESSNFQQQQESSNFQQLIALVNQYKNDPETLARQEEIKRVASDQAKDNPFSSFGTTAEEYVAYMGKNGREVQTYLEANPDIKQQIDDLSAQVNSLLEEYESLKMNADISPRKDKESGENYKC